MRERAALLLRFVRRLARLGCGLLALALSATATAQPAWRVPDPALIEPANVAGYYAEVLRLALRKGGSAPGEPHIEWVGGRGMVRERYRRMLAAGEIDVLWSSSTPAREAEFLPVRFNLLKGLNEHRLLLVRRVDLPRFRGVRDLRDLRAFSAGAGTHWSDAQILRANGLRVVTANQHPSLFRMLALGRFDFLALGAAEIDDALQAHADLDLVIEPRLVVRYHQPIYFFVNRRQPALAERILRGLQRAARNGSLEQVFMAHATLRDAWERVSRPGRHSIALQPLEARAVAPAQVLSRRTPGSSQATTALRSAAMAS